MYESRGSHTSATRKNKLFDHSGGGWTLVYTMCQDGGGSALASGISHALPVSPAKHQPVTSLPYAKAVARLQQLPLAATPEHGLSTLVDTCRLVVVGAEALGAPPPSADELLPLIAYVCIASQVLD